MIHVAVDDGRGHSVAGEGLAPSAPPGGCWQPWPNRSQVGYIRSNETGTPFVAVAGTTFGCHANGFTNADLRALTTELRGLPPGAMTAGQTTYDLRRLKHRGLIIRIPHTHRYRVSDYGLHTAHFLTCLHDLSGVLWSDAPVYFDETVAVARCSPKLRRYDQHRDFEPGFRGEFVELQLAAYFPVISANDRSGTAAQGLAHWRWSAD